MKEVKNIGSSVETGDKVQINDSANNNNTGVEVKKDDIKPTSTNNTAATSATVTEESK
jgi:hypothetical protein